MSWLSRADLETVLRDRGFTRYRVIERRGEVQIEVPARDFYDAIVTVGLGGAAGIRVNLIALAWWRCWFDRKQWLRDM